MSFDRQPPAVRDSAGATASHGTPLIWMLEHPPVYTGGTSATKNDLLNVGNIPTHLTGRGGQWTWHGPGQRVVYIMLDLKKREKDIKKYINNLEQWSVSTLRFFNIDGFTSFSKGIYEICLTC